MGDLRPLPEEFTTEVIAAGFQTVWNRLKLKKSNNNINKNINSLNNSNNNTKNLNNRNSVSNNDDNNHQSYNSSGFENNNLTIIFNNINNEVKMGSPYPNNNLRSNSIIENNLKNSNIKDNNIKNSNLNKNKPNNNNETENNSNNKNKSNSNSSNKNVTNAVADQPSILTTVFCANWRSLIILFLIRLGFVALDLLKPVVLGSLLQHVTERSELNGDEGQLEGK